MATNSNASSSNSSSGNPARYSTLKLLKNTLKQKPPPPPPKDPYYLQQNRSLLSLSPDSLSIPPQSPLSPSYSQYPHKTSPGPSQSTMSLVSSAASTKSVAPSDHKAAKKKKSIKLFSFGRRASKATTSKDSDADPLPPMPTEDENISWPSNFQHNIHVDGAFIGLPPSWSKSLVNMGFTEEEIANMNAKRQAAALNYPQMYNNRPESPASYTSPSAMLYERSTSPPAPNQQVNANISNPLVHAHQYSDVSLESRSLSVPISAASISPNSINTANPTLPQPGPSHQTPYLHNPSSSLASLSSDSHQSSVSADSFEQPAIASTVHGVDPYPSPQSLHQPPPNSYPSVPPPAYGFAVSSAYSRDRSGSASSVLSGQAAANGTQIIPSAASTSVATGSTKHRPQGSQGSTVSQASESTSGSSSIHSTSQRTPKRATALPPRLSLHASSDSDDWSKLILSATQLSADDESKKDHVSQTPRPAPSTKPARSPPDRLKPIAPLNVEKSSSSRKNRVTDSSHSQPSDSGNLASSTRNPPITPSSESTPTSASLWKEEFKDYVEKEDFRNPRYSVALTDESSPTLPEINTPIQASRRDTLRLGPNGKLLVPQQGENDEDDELLGVRSNRNSARSSSSTLSTSTITGYTYSSPEIVRKVSIVRRAGAYVAKVPVGGVKGRPEVLPKSTQEQKAISLTENPPLSPMGSTFGFDSSKQLVQPSSPMNSQFGSDRSSASAGSGGSTASSSLHSQEYITPTTDPGTDLDLSSYYVPTPSPSKSQFPEVHSHPHSSQRDTFGNVKEDDRLKNDICDAQTLEDGSLERNHSGIPRPTIIISDDPSSPPASIPAPFISMTLSPQTPVHRYPGWLSGVVAPLSAFIDEAVEPRDHYIDLQEIAEGESGSIFAARLLPENADKLRLSPEVKALYKEEMDSDEPVLVAMKIIAMTPPSDPPASTPERRKLQDLEKELTLLKGLWHEHILGLDALYVDLKEDTLWVRMELMERSLADIVGLVAHGLILQDRMMARFTRDILLALEFLQSHRIAHRDVRSDNLLLNSRGILKLTDFSNAVKLPEESPMRSDLAGVIFWQAPEMRQPQYDALKVDVWSVGATMWEMAETEPPFSDTKQVQSRWPPLTRREIWSPAFHSFLWSCSEPAAKRKNSTELLKDPFVTNACGRGVIVQLLSRCVSIEKTIQDTGV